MRGHIILSTGLLLVFTSFLFFARQAGTYMLLLTLGLLISLVSYLALLFGEKSNKTKIVWTLIVLIAVGIEYITEPLLVKSSYLIYVSANAEELKSINDILIRHSGDINISGDTIVSEKSHLTSDEIKQLKSLREKVNAYVILKSNSDIYYGLYGFLDVSLGVAYIINDSKTNTQLARSHLIDNWYY